MEREHLKCHLCSPRDAPNPMYYRDYSELQARRPAPGFAACRRAPAAPALLFPP